MCEKISIIVPAYNIESYIENTITMICQQTYKNLEIILVNDGSKDNTPRIMDKLAESDIRIKVLHKKNEGVTKARLAGVKIATGDWIGFVDGDDMIEPDMYQRLLDNAYKYKADISHCGYQMVFPSHVDYYYNTGILVEQDKMKGVKDLLSGSFIEPGLWNKLFRKNLLDNLLHNEKMDTSIKINEDLLMNFYLFMDADKSIYEDFCPYRYMIRSGSTSTARINESRLRDPLLVQKIIKNQLPESSELLQLVDNRIIRILISLSTMHLGTKKELILPYRCKARKELKQMLPFIMKENFSRKMKILSLWASISPSTYSFIHAVYAHVKGTDRKYEVK